MFINPSGAQQPHCINKDGDVRLFFWMIFLISMALSGQNYDGYARKQDQKTERSVCWAF
jgi:hypothetical protein